mmetsp:Transcript_46728/g.124088  ORF Transcript_46728/g.124088 Transcript_46728/m.124088 type:complete len:151 (-) Transcript_46728:759-1211(-)
MEGARAGGARQIATVLASISNTSTPFRFKTAHFSETFRWDDACCTILRHLAMSWMNPIIQRRLWRVLSAKFLLVSSPDVNANAGRSGTAFPVEAVEFFATYLLQNLAARPPDHLVRFFAFTLFPFHSSLFTVQCHCNKGISFPKYLHDSL